MITLYTDNKTKLSLKKQSYVYGFASDIVLKYQFKNNSFGAEHDLMAQLTGLPDKLLSNIVIVVSHFCGILNLGTELFGFFKPLRLEFYKIG